jgi:hypothetical protein
MGWDYPRHLEGRLFSVAQDFRFVPKTRHLHVNEYTPQPPMTNHAPRQPDCRLKQNRCSGRGTITGNDMCQSHKIPKWSPFPVGQQNSDHVLFEKLKNGNPLCLYACPDPLTLLSNFLTDYRFLSQ